MRTKELEVTAENENGDKTLLKAVAVITVVRTKDGFILDIRENGDLTEDWWRSLPAAMMATIDKMIIERRRVNTP